MVEALEIIELFCDMLLARFGLIETMRCVYEHVGCTCACMYIYVFVFVVYIVRTFFNE